MSEVLELFDVENQESETEKESEYSKTQAKLKKLNIFSKQVIERLIKNKIPPTPENFSVYFEKLLEEKPQSQKIDIEEILKVENYHDNKIEYLTKIDIFLKENYESTKKLLEDINKLYTRISKLKLYIKKYGLELTHNPSKQRLLAFEKSVNSAIEALDKQQEIVKDDFLNITNMMKKFNKESIFDQKYGIFNKKYIFEEIEKELQNISHFRYKSSLVAFKVSYETLKNVKLQSDREIIIKTVISIVHQRSRRSDILAHYGDNICLLLLKHTDYAQALKAVDSIANLISYSNFIIDAKQIFAQIDTNIVELNPNLSVEEIVGEAISGVLK